MDKKWLVPFFLIAMLLLAACEPLSSVKANSEPTQQAATATVTNTPTLTPTLTATPLAPTATPTATPRPTQAATSTPTPLPTQVSTPTPTAIPVPCYKATFIEDVTLPDGTLVNPGDTLTKTWRLENTGSCAWTTGTALVFTSGALMGAQSEVDLPSVVNPGSSVDLSVNLVMPLKAGTYQGNWMLRSPDGALFGVGSNADSPFWVRITVNSNFLFAVTSVDVSVSPSSYIGICPATFTFTADITANAAGTVTYKWVRSDGSQSPEGTLTFTAAGTQTVVDTLEVGTPGASTSGWAEVYIDQPNHQTFSQIGYNLICNPAPTPTATWVPPTLTPTPTATQVPPTLTPTPTATRVPPTLTPTPTATRVPPTLTPTPTAIRVPPILTPTPTGKADR